jgi:hypothetical protein
MKLLFILISAIVTLSLIGCGETTEVIETNCVKTNLWVLQSGKSRTRQVYDCSGINVEQLVEQIKKD